MKKLFTAAELEEMRRADEEIDLEFRWTKDELAASRARDKEFARSELPESKKKLAAKQKAYYEANREEIAAKQKAYREARKRAMKTARKGV